MSFRTIFWRASACILALAAFPSTAGAQRTTFAASPGDPTVRVLVARWVEAGGKRMAWTPTFDLPIRDAARLNQLAGLEAADNLQDALQRLLGVLNDETARIPSDAGQAEPLQACVFPTTVAVVALRTGCEAGTRQHP